MAKINVIKILSLGKKSLRYKLLIAFSIMSIIPLLIITYFVTNYVFEDNAGDMFQVSAIVLFCMWLIWAGYIMVKEIINPIIDLAVETKMIADGSVDSKILLRRDDELGEIATAVNTMTGKMRGYIGELQEYSKKTASLNVRIHRKVLTLTNLMRLGDIISSGAGFEEISNFAAERLAGELYGGFCAIFIKEAIKKYGLKSFMDNSGTNVNIHDFEGELPEIERLFAKNEWLVVDADPLRKPWQQELRQKFEQMNVIMFPMKIKSNVVGVIVLGNFEEGVKFDPEDIEVMRAFENELILGYQSSQTIDKISSLEVVDSLTGLYSFNYIKERLEDEINRAVFYQRPCSFLMINIDNYKDYVTANGVKKGETLLKYVAKLLSEARPPVGKVARLDNDEFGMLVPEMNKREIIELGEKIRSKVEEMEFSKELKGKITVSIGAGENPIDGATATAIVSSARRFLLKAREEGGNRVIGE